MLRATKVAKIGSVMPGRKPSNPIVLWLTNARLYGAEDQYPGKRNHQRFQWRMPVTLEVESVDGRRFSLYGHTRDISEGGVGLECRQRIEPYSFIRIRGDGQADDAIEGYIVHCTQGLGTYRIGVRFSGERAA